MDTQIVNGVQSVTLNISTTFGAQAKALIIPNQCIWIVKEGQYRAARIGYNQLYQDKAELLLIWRKVQSSLHRQFFVNDKSPVAFYNELPVQRRRPIL